MVDDLRAADAVLPVEQGEGQAVVLELSVVLPAVMGPVELVAVVEPGGFYAEADGEVDRNGGEVARMDRVLRGVGGRAVAVDPGAPTMRT